MNMENKIFIFIFGVILLVEIMFNIQQQLQLNSHQEQINCLEQQNSMELWDITTGQYVKRFGTDWCHYLD